MPRFLALLIMLCAATAHAQTFTGEVAKACVPKGEIWSADHEHENVTERWPREAAKLKGVPLNVAREKDRLRLALDGGKTVELQDCPYGDTGQQYLFERYDQSGPFYVLTTLEYEDHYYSLVMRQTGKLVKVFGLPVWASDRSKFLSVACVLHPEVRGELTIYTPATDGIAKEAAFELPCVEQTCAARWEGAGWISVSCRPWEDDKASDKKKSSDFVLIRGNDGWRKFGR